MTARLVSVEGSDGLGKTTQIALLAKELRSRGHRVATVKFPRYDTWIGCVLRWMLRTGSARRSPNLFQVLQWIDKIVLQLFFLSCLLRSNDFVLFDRWQVSMWAYGLADGANERLTRALVDTLVRPDLTFVFHGSTKRDFDLDSYERDRSYQNNVVFHYMLWTCADEDVCLVDADDTVDRITISLLDRVLSLPR